MIKRGRLHNIPTGISIEEPVTDLRGDLVNKLQEDVPENPPILPGHMAWLDGLRALAALYVMCHHILLISFDHKIDQLPVIDFILGGPFRYGHYAVGLFIVISGFSLMLPIARGDGSLRGGPVPFYARRAKRILPTYYLAFIFSLATRLAFVQENTNLHWHVGWSEFQGVLFSHLLLLQDVFSSGLINGAFWSIAVEWHIYFLFPILVLAFARWGPVKVAACVLILSTAVFFMLRNTMFMGICPEYYALFAFGMLACKIACGRDALDIRLRKLPWATIAALLFATFIGNTYVFRGKMPSFVHFGADILNGFFAVAFIIAASTSGQNVLRRALSWKPLEFVGQFAYSIYLIHVPMIWLVLRYVIYPITTAHRSDFVIMLLGGVPVILGIAYLFFLTCEKPFLNKRRPSIPPQTASGHGSPLGT